MKKVVFSSHALLRMQERGIGKKLIIDALENPDKAEVSSVNPARVLLKKLYFNKTLKREHLLMIITEKEDNKIRVIAIIDTSKISKYF